MILLGNCILLGCSEFLNFDGVYVGIEGVAADTIVLLLNIDFDLSLVIVWKEVFVAASVF